MSAGMSDAQYFGRKLSMVDIEKLVHGYVNTNRFESLVAGKVGVVPNMKELAMYADKPSSTTVQGQAVWEAGKLSITLNSESASTELEPAKLEQLLGPSLKVMDVDYRNRSQLPKSKPSQCDLLFSYGQVDEEKATHIDGSPHLDGSLDAPDLYYVVAIGPTTCFYEGTYSGERMQLLSNFDLLDEQIKSQQASYHTPQSGEIVLATFCSVHSSPGVSLLGMPRVFLKAYYRPPIKMEGPLPS